MDAPGELGEPECLIARFGELWLKGKNRGFFEKTLARNVRRALGSVGGGSVERLHGQLLVRPAERPRDAARRLQDVFGLASISPAWRTRPSVEAVAERAPAVLARALEEWPRDRRIRFRVATKRADKRFPLGSTELDRVVAERALPPHAERLEVDLSDPELSLEILVRSEAAYLFHERLPGAGGLPVGTLGRVTCLLSGGIDSPVAAWLAMKRGCHVDFVSFHSAPYLGEPSREKVRDLARALTRYQRGARLFEVPFARIQEAVRDGAPESYRTVLYRRAMQRLASRVAERAGAAALVTGESVGQVASQTLENLRCIEDASSLPVLRPLVSFDKHETIALARRIGTYELSIRPEPDCCTVFQPSAPVIRGRLEVCRQVERELALEPLVETALEGVEPSFFEA